MAKNHGIKLRAQNHYKVYKTQHLALTTIITCSAKFSFVKFCRCRALKYKFLWRRYGHILSQKVRAYELW